MVQVVRLEQKDSTQLLFRFGEWTIGNDHSAVLKSQRCGVTRRIERFPADKVTVLPEHVVIGEALIQKAAPFLFGHRFQLLLIHVPKAYVFHNLLLIKVD